MEADAIRLSDPVACLERHDLVESDGLNLLRRLARVYFEEEVEEVLEARRGTLAPTYGRARALEEDEDALYWQRMRED